LVDALVVASSLGFALLLRFIFNFDQVFDLEQLHFKALAFVSVLILGFYYNDLYVGLAPRSRRELLLRIGQSHVVAAVFLSLIYYAVPLLALGRGVLVLSLPLSMFTITLWRLFYYWVLHRGSLVENILVLGTGETAQNLVREVLHKGKTGHHILGFVGNDPAEVGRSLVNPSVLGTFENLPSICQRLQVDTVIVAIEDRRGKLPLAELLQCKMSGVRVEETPSFYEALTGQIPIRNLRPSWLIFSPGF
jgi:FlaA1/EpsC-like NDP-sugar epimerase